MQGEPPEHHDIHQQQRAHEYRPQRQPALHRQHAHFQQRRPGLALAIGLGFLQCIEYE